MGIQPEPDDLCPHCGVPVPMHRRKSRCPHCDRPFEPSRHDPRATGYLTPFGYGMCGLVAGSQMGSAAALATSSAQYGDPRLLLFPILGGIACALIVAAVGRRLSVPVRRGYETLVLSLAFAGVAVFCLALAGVTSPDALLPAGACALVLAAPVVWKAMFGRTSAGERT